MSDRLLAIPFDLMTLTTLGTLVTTAASAALAWSLGGTQGTGVLAGALLAGAIALAAAAHQKQMAVERPAMVLPAFALAFLVRLAVLVGLTILFRYVEFAAARIEWRHFLASFAVVSVALLFVSMPESARGLKTR